VYEVFDEYRVNIHKMHYRIYTRYIIQSEIDSTVFEVLDVYRVTLYKMYITYVMRCIIQMRCILQFMKCLMYTESHHTGDVLSNIYADMLYSV